MQPSSLIHNNGCPNLRGALQIDTVRGRIVRREIGAAVGKQACCPKIILFLQGTSIYSKFLEFYGYFGTLNA